ncbi:MAG: TIGR01777 family oxidoreductase [Bacteroidia bacterium]|nr:TIGR01777 family oxidoreductase [Bacteroidia bacterium]MDW8088458.1 TIGR01777 family oxidoreductase [Bacteroidia bacterium]
MARVLLTGGTGLIGSGLVPALQAAGYEPVVLSRRAVNLNGATVVRWDGRKIPASLTSDGVVAVINLAGANVAARRWSSNYKEELWQSRVEVTKEVAAWLKREAPMARLISASAIGYYGSGLSLTVYTEESPPGEDFLARLALAWEAAAQTAPKPPVLFRIGVVLAPQAKAWQGLRTSFRVGFGAYPAPGRQGFSWVHQEDVVRAFLWALEKADASGAYNLTAPQPLSVRAFVEALGAHTGHKLIFRIPETLLRWGLGEQAILLTRGIYAYPKRLLAEGFEFRFPKADQAIADLLERERKSS